MNKDEINENGVVTKALEYLKSKHNGELPYRFGQLEIGKWMARYAQQVRRKKVLYLLIGWEQYKKANWWESDSIDVEKVLMDQFIKITNHQNQER